MSFVEKLQKKPKTMRVLILWLATGLVMIIIIIVWIFSFSQNSKSSEEKKNAEATELPSLFKSIGKDFSIFKQSLEASLKDIKSETNDLEKQLEDYENQEK